MNKWHRGASRGVSVPYTIFINGTQMLTLRPHQERIINRLQNYNKGQVIVPTGGGKTSDYDLFMDAQSSMDRCNNGVTTVVVAPRILLAEQLCSEFMEVIDPNNSDPYLHVMHVHSGETHHVSTTKQTKSMLLMQTVLAIWVRMLSSSPPTILSIVSWRQILR